MSMAIERLAVELIKLPVDTWDGVHAQHSIGEPSFTTDASWDASSEYLIHRQMATDTHA